MELQISVIIPVYNAAPFVRKAVESALAQPETAEVLLIEDGSPDNSLEICRQLDAEYDKVRLFTHEGNVNLGAGPTRNVGIDNAKFDFIAFLDADDYYLPDRFRAERKIFVEKPDADGVYGAAGRHYYSELAREHFRKLGALELLSAKWRYKPEELFESLIGLRPAHGTISPITLTVKRHAILRAGHFSSLRLHQDTELIIKLSYVARLEPGEMDKPVAMIGVHDENRISRVSAHPDSRVLLYGNLLTWARENNLSKEYAQTLDNLQIVSRIKQIGKMRGTFLLLYASFTKSGFFNRRFLYQSLDHIMSGKLSKLVSTVRGKSE